MSTNEDKKEDQKPKEVPNEKKAEDSSSKPEYKGNNPGGDASKK
jgi:hypothetical protein